MSAISKCERRGSDGRVILIEPDWAGKLSGFTLLFEALVLTMCRQMPFAAVARMVGETWHRVQAICRRYVDLALAKADLSKLTMLAIDETSSRRGHNYLTFAADAGVHKVVFVTEGRDAKTVSEFSHFLSEHKAAPEPLYEFGIGNAALLHFRLYEGARAYLPFFFGCCVPHGESYRFSELSKTIDNPSYSLAIRNDG
jgi:hypothetical protein